MKLTDDASQAPERAEEDRSPGQSFLQDFLPYRLSIASNAVSEVIASTYRALFGLSVAQWRVLAVVADFDAPTGQEVVVATRMDKVGVSRAVANLVARGLIERQLDRRDRRAQRLRLSPAGRALHAQVVPEAMALESELLAGFSAKERVLLATFLDRLMTAAIDAPDRL